MKCILISPSFPPTNKVSSLRGYYFAMALKDAGWEVDVICNRSEDETLPRDCDGISIFRTDSKNSAACLIAEMSRMILRRKSTGIDYDLIVSTYGPSASHILGRISCSAWKNAKWIADYRDLWSSDEYYTKGKRGFFKRKFAQKTEELILRRANLITTVSKGLSDSLSEFHGRNVKIYRNGFEKYPIDAEEKTTKFPLGTISICYTGTINQHRNPVEFLDCLAHLKKTKNKDFKVTFVGSAEESVMLEIGSHLKSGQAEYLGKVSRKSAYKIQNESNICLLLEDELSTRKGALTGKIFEYLYLRKPIIAYGIAPDSELSEIIHNSGLCIYSGNNRQSLIQALHDLPEKMMGLEPDLEYIHSFSRAAIAESFACAATELFR